MQCILLQCAERGGRGSGGERIRKGLLLFGGKYGADDEDYVDDEDAGDDKVYNIFHCDFYAVT